MDSSSDIQRDLGIDIDIPPVAAKTQGQANVVRIASLTGSAAQGDVGNFGPVYPLDKPPAQASVQPMEPLSSRKRPHGSDHATQDPSIRTESASPSGTRQTSTNPRQDSKTSSKHPPPLPQQRAGARATWASHRQSSNPRLPSKLQPNQFYDDQPLDRRRSSNTTRPEMRWADNRPRGPSVTVNDSIAALPRIFGYSQLPPDFRLLSSSSNYADNDEEPLVVNTGIIKQPDSRPISQQQLAAEVKGIYSGLVLVEQKCADVVSDQTKTTQQRDPRSRQTSDKTQTDQFSALIALHRTLLHEHHDFFLASQHPSAGNAIKDLATKNQMSARMWKHGIHNFLELLRHRLPESLEFMLAFIYLAYQMMALLFETVPTFEDTWIECLGDLARYRMAIEDEDLRVREVWTGVARFWYMRAADKNPHVGRLLHHLGILARTNPLQQLSLYCRSLTARQPFLSSRESIITLFDPTVARVRKATNTRPVSNDTWFVVLNACWFGVQGTSDLLESAITGFVAGLNTRISEFGPRWKEYGACIASSLLGGILKYGCTDSKLRVILAKRENPSNWPSCPEPKIEPPSPDPDDLCNEDASMSSMSNRWRVTLNSFIIVLRRTRDSDVFSYVIVMLVFLWNLASTPEGAAYIDRFIPWDQVATFVNAISPGLDFSRSMRLLESEVLTPTDDGPLPEDYLIRGQVWGSPLFPPTWFDKAPLDIDERFIEREGFTERRKYRIKWLACRIAASKKAAEEANIRRSHKRGRPPDPNTSQQTGLHRVWLHYDSANDLFSEIQLEETPASYEVEHSASPNEPMSGVEPT